jgi:hypothetical protein
LCHGTDSVTLAALESNYFYMADEMNQPAPSSSKNKWLYIIIGVVAVLVVFGFLARMSGYMAMRAAGVNVQPGAGLPGQGGTATYTATNGQGSVTVGGNKMPDNWPSDAPQPFAGAAIQYAGTSNPTTGKAGAAVAYTVKAPVTDVINYYKSQLTATGWTVESTATMGATSVLSAKKDTRTMGISIVETGNGSVQVSAGLDI